MSRIRALALVAASALAVACTDGPSPLEPPATESALAPALTLVDASGPGGLDGFHFRPPIGAAPPHTENLDGSLLDLLSVEICEWDGSECVLPLLRELTSALRPPEQLKVSGDGIYGTLWNTRRDDLDPNKTYRIRVLASGGELGYVDVDVLDPDVDDRNEGDTDHVHLVPGQTLPIRFVVEVGTGERAGSSGAIVELADGDIVLDVPADALTEDVLLTVAPTNVVPSGGPPVVPGTAWDFGPDGLEFDHPVFMTIAYDPADVPEGVDENELRIHKLVDGEFIQQNAGLVDLVNHTVSAEVDGFSVFVVIPRDPENPEDILPPEVRSLQVRDPSTGTWGNAVTLNLSTSDGVLDFRINIVDNITGVRFIDVRWLSPTGRQVRFPCFTGNPPDAGSDTNGTWTCRADFPQYAEAGLWQPQLIWIFDKINNEAFYNSGASGFCDYRQSQCVSDIPAITVVSDPQDISAPVVQSFTASPDIQPRAFGPSASLDTSTGSQWVVFGLQATDDLSGVGGGFFYDYFEFRLTGPSGQVKSRQMSCTLAQGTTLNGFWECSFFLEQQSEPGTWEVTFLRVPDRVGNGGFSYASYFTPDGSGQLCNQDGACVTPPTVQVVGAGDGQPPSVVSVGIALDQTDVVTTTLVTDALSGVANVYVRYNSVETTQWQDCWATLGTGTTNAGSWACTISFSEFAARGQWELSLQVYDVAGNNRYYYRRSTDGFLCYWDPTTTQQVCQDFGVTDIVLQ